MSGRELPDESGFTTPNPLTQGDLMTTPPQDENQLLMQGDLIDTPPQEQNPLAQQFNNAFAPAQGFQPGNFFNEPVQANNQPPVPVVTPEGRRPGQTQPAPAAQNNLMMAFDDEATNVVTPPPNPPPNRRARRN